MINDNAKTSLRTRRWVLTINNPDLTKEQLKDYVINHYKTRYLIIGNEIAPTTGTPHFQMYLEFHNPATFNQLKKRFPTAHIQIANGSAEDSKIYCSKDNDYIEYGAPFDVAYVQAEEIPAMVINMLRKNYNIFQIIDKMPNTASFIIKNIKQLQEMKKEIANYEAYLELTDNELPF
jgi:hypothetical protein